MKTEKNMLTLDTLDRFESIFDVETLTEAQVEKVEYLAYCANMRYHYSKEFAWRRFVYLLAIDLGIDLYQ